MIRPASNLLLPSLLFLSSCFQAKGQSLPPCSTAQVTYSPVTSDFERKIQISRIGVPFKPPAVEKRVKSVQGTRWFVELAPDYMKNGPWTTTLYLGKSDSNRAYLVASFKDHGNTFSAHWVNEELLFVQVWWGRIASSDLILDVAKGRFIYNQLANYGQIIEPCS